MTARYKVQFSPEAVTHLDELELYVAEAASQTIAAKYVDAIVSFCEGLSTFPHRGSRRDDIREGLRTVGFRRATIAFDVTEDVVSIIGIYYRGRDFGAELSGDRD